MASQNPTNQQDEDVADDEESWKYFLLSFHFSDEGKWGPEKLPHNPTICISGSGLMEQDSLRLHLGLFDVMNKSTKLFTFTRSSASQEGWLNLTTAECTAKQELSPQKAASKDWWVTPAFVLSRSVVSDSLRPHGLCGPPGSSVRGILQVRIPEWVATSLSNTCLYWLQISLHLCLAAYGHSLLVAFRLGGRPTHHTARATEDMQTWYHFHLHVIPCTDQAVLGGSSWIEHRFMMER